jgi:hypothetical protein
VLKNQEASLVPTAEDFRWKDLYRIGSISSGLIAVLIVLAVVAYFIWPYAVETASTEEIFIGLQNDRLGGLMSLDLLLLVVEVFNVLLLLALYVSLRQVNESYALIALVFGLIGVVLIFVVRPLADLVYLSDQYIAAATEVAKSQYLAAGEALLALFSGTSWMLFTLFMAISGLSSSLLMFQSHIFKRSTAITGLISSAPGLLFFIPVLGTLLLFLGTFASILWCLMMARDLFQFERVYA